MGDVRTPSEDLGCELKVLAKGRESVPSSSSFTLGNFVTPDEEDKKAAERGEPIKIIYPVTYAQIQTTLSALMSVYGRRPFFELEGRGPESYRASKLMELELQYQLDQIGSSLTWYLWFQDMLKYGL